MFNFFAKTTNRNQTLAIPYPDTNSKQILQIQFFFFTLIYLASSWLYLFNNLYFGYDIPYISWSYLALLLTLSGMVVASLFIKDEYPRFAYWLSGYCKYIVILFSVRYACSVSIMKTPFPLVDTYVAALDSTLTFKVTDVINWAVQNNTHDFFWEIYGLIIPQLFITPLFLLLFKRNHDLECFNITLLLTALCAGIIYYFLPVSAPAAIYTSKYFSPTQHYITEAFYNIQLHNIPPSKAYYFMGMPSFHVIWTVACAFAVRHIPVVRCFYFVLSILMVFSTLTTGWHFLTDVIVGLLLVVFCQLLAERRTTLPQNDSSHKNAIAAT